MNFGYSDIQNIIYQNAIRMKYPGAGKFAKDTAKLVWAMIEEREGGTVDPFWKLSHDFDQSLEGDVARFEKLLGILLPRRKEAEPYYRFILEQEKQGRRFSKFAAWAKSPERKQWLPKYFSKPEYLQVDYMQAFDQNVPAITRNEDGSINV